MTGGNHVSSALLGGCPVWGRTAGGTPVILGLHSLKLAKSRLKDVEADPSDSRGKEGKENHAQNLATEIWSNVCVYKNVPNTKGNTGGIKT